MIFVMEGMFEKMKKQIVVISAAVLVLAVVGVTVYSVFGGKTTQVQQPTGSAADSAQNGVYGPSVTKGNVHTPLEKIFTVENKSGCTNLNSMCIDGKNLYCIKTKSDNTTSELFMVDSYESGARTLTSRNHTGLYHANGLTFLGGALYVATMQPPDPNNSNTAQIWKMSTSGEKSTAYRSDKDTIYSITRFVGDTFLVGLNGSDASKKEYAVATLSDGKIILNKKFYVDQMQAYGTGQDISYAKGYLYIPTWSGTVGNKILKVNVGDSITDGKQYTPEEVIEVDTNDTSITKLEVESMDVDESGRMVICTNFETATDKNTDTIFRFPK